MKDKVSQGNSEYCVILKISLMLLQLYKQLHSSIAHTDFIISVYKIQKSTAIKCSDSQKFAQTTQLPAAFWLLKCQEFPLVQFTYRSLTDAMPRLLILETCFKLSFSNVNHQTLVQQSANVQVVQVFRQHNQLVYYIMVLYSYVQLHGIAPNTTTLIIIQGTNQLYMTVHLQASTVVLNW